MKCHLTGDREFTTDKEMFSYIKENKSSIIKSLKSQVKTKTNTMIGFYSTTDKVVKNMPDLDDDYIYPVISNTNYLDNHRDVHLDNSMNKTAKEQNGKIIYTTDHEIKINNIIAYPEDVEMSIQEMDWKQLGKDYNGTTQCLMFKVKKSEIINSAFKRTIELGKKQLQNSIRMIYVKADLGFNDNDPDFAQEKQYYDEAYQKAVNKEAFEDIKVVTLVRELKIYLEGSAVPYGSNDATPILEKTKEAVDDTSEIVEPSNDTQISVTEMLQKIKV